MAKDFKELSKENWVPNMGTVTNDSIKTGCLQRIADASELMASNFIALQNDRDYYKRRLNEESESGERMARRIRALQGVITKMKKKK